MFTPWPQSVGRNRQVCGVGISTQDYSVQQLDSWKVVDLTEDDVMVGIAGKAGHGVV